MKNIKILTLSSVLLLLYLIVILLVAGCNPNGKNSQKIPEEAEVKSTYQLVWQDEFNYSGLPDSSKWKYDTEGNDAGWGNNESQHYTESKLENAQVENGILFITAQKEHVGDKEYTSARIISKADWKYGKVEVKAKIPSARGTWSAVWMMPADWSFNDGNWPDIGEIDIMEHVGHDLGVIHASAHAKDYQWQTDTQKTATINVPDVSEKFHAYILEWTPDVIKAYVDDSLYYEYYNEGLGESKWPFDKPFNLILNVAVGGTWGNTEGIDEDAFPQTMEIDYVRIYQKDAQLVKEK